MIRQTKKYPAFTLAETLLTLMIIGVIASMTIPSLIKNTHQKETVSLLKKEYSTFTNAFDLAVQNYGPPTIWGWGSSGNAIGAMNGMKIMSQYWNVERFCGTEKGCFPDVTYKYVNGTAWLNVENTASRPKVKLSDGAVVHTYSQNAKCQMSVGTTESLKHVCGEILVDVNGYKEPNQAGVDLFLFWVTIDGIVPAGTHADSFYTLETNCVTGTGWGCAGWVVTMENMDYLSKNVSW